MENLEKNALDNLFVLQSQILQNNRSPLPYQAGQALKSGDLNQVIESVEAIMCILTHVFENESGIENIFQGDKVFSDTVDFFTRLYASKIITGNNAQVQVDETTTGGLVHNEQVSVGIGQGIVNEYGGRSISLGHHRANIGSTSSYSGLYSGGDLIGYKHPDNQVCVGNTSSPLTLFGRNIYIDASSKVTVPSSLSVRSIHFTAGDTINGVDTSEGINGKLEVRIDNAMRGQIHFTFSHGRITNLDFWD